MRKTRTSEQYTALSWLWAGLFGPLYFLFRLRVGAAALSCVALIAPYFGYDALGLSEPGAFVTPTYMVVSAILAYVVQPGPVRLTPTEKERQDKTGQYIVFDVETTGLRQGSPHPQNEPSILQIAAILYNQHGHQLEMLNTMVKPIDWNCNPVPVPNTNFHREHGLTQERVDNEGIPHDEAMRRFDAMVQRCRSDLFAHNAAFDAPIVRSALLRSGIDPSRFDSLAMNCTMETTTGILKLPGKYGKFKWPTLSEAYKRLVDKSGFGGAHDAINDVLAASDLVRVIAKRRIPVVAIDSGEIANRISTSAQAKMLAKKAA